MGKNNLKAITFVMFGNDFSEDLQDDIEIEITEDLLQVTDGLKKAITSIRAYQSGSINFSILTSSQATINFLLNKVQEMNFFYCEVANANGLITKFTNCLIEEGSDTISTGGESNGFGFSIKFQNYSREQLIDG